MGAIGSSADNVPARSFNVTLKHEPLARSRVEAVGELQGAAVGMFS